MTPRPAPAGAARDFGGLLASRLGRRFAAGPEAADALRVAADLRSRGLLVACEHVAHPPRAAAGEGTADVLELLRGLAATGLGEGGAVEVLAGVGTGAGHLDRLADAAGGAGTRLTVRPGSADEAGAALDAAARLRPAHPDTGVEVWAALRRTESDLATLLDGRAGTPPRVLLRALPEGARATGPDAVPAGEVDRAFVRHARRLLQGSARPVLAVADPALRGVVETLAAEAPAVPAGSWELFVAMGRRDAEAGRLAALGRRVRVRVAYGPRWRAEGMRGLAALAPVPRRGSW